VASPGLRSPTILETYNPFMARTLICVVLLLLCTTLPVSSLWTWKATSRAPRSSRGEYFWPEARGRPDNYGVSPYTVPRNLTERTLAWTWSNGGPVNKYTAGTHTGVVIDDKMNIYLSSSDGVRKFTTNGSLVWYRPMISWRIPTLANGKLYISENSGDIVALSMLTGTELWRAHFSSGLGSDVSGVAVHQGVVLTESEFVPVETGGAKLVVGLDADDGHKLWEFHADSRLWNFMPILTDNDTFIFQDQVGGVYHLRVADGRRIWKSGYEGAWAYDFTDGLAMVKDGVVYAVHADGPCCFNHQRATLRAYDLATGDPLWKQDFAHPVNSQPMVGYLGRGAGLAERLAVVMPVGAQPIGQFDTYLSSISTFDAKTGEPLWSWTPPPWLGSFVAGDEQRLKHGGPICLPNPYASPSIDARGTVYVGHFNGNVYAIRDDDGDGTISDMEVSRYDTGAGFSHGGAALAPEMLAIASCDALYVFKE